MQAGTVAGSATGIATIGGIQFAHVAGGSFRMGHVDYSDAPVRETLVRGFRMGVDPVTNAQMDQFTIAMRSESDPRRAVLAMADSFRSSSAANGLHIDEGCHFLEMLRMVREASDVVPSFDRYRDLSSRVFSLPDHPAVRVSLPEMAAYALWFSAQNGALVRLPTEAERERAARGVSGKDDFATPNGQAKNDAGELQIHVEHWDAGDAKFGTAAVQEQLANSFGIRGLSGNVWERVLDWYADTYDLNTANNPFGPLTGQYRVLRGGSWDRYPKFARSAFRYSLVPGYRRNDIGFRLVSPAAPQDSQPA